MSGMISVYVCLLPVLAMSLESWRLRYNATDTNKTTLSYKIKGEIIVTNLRRMQLSSYECYATNP